MMYVSQSVSQSVSLSLRKHMGPEVLSAICFLTVNREFWAEGKLMAGYVVQEVMSEERAARDRESRRQERERETGETGGGKEVCL